MTLTAELPNDTPNHAEHLDTLLWLRSDAIADQDEADDPRQHDQRIADLDAQIATTKKLATVQGYLSVVSYGADPVEDYITQNLLWLVGRGDRLSAGQRARVAGASVAISDLLSAGAAGDELDESIVGAVDRFCDDVRRWSDPAVEQRRVRAEALGDMSAAADA